MGCRIVDIELGDMGFGSRGKRVAEVDIVVEGMGWVGKVGNFGFGSTGVVWKGLYVEFGEGHLGL